MFDFDVNRDKLKFQSAVSMNLIKLVKLFFDHSFIFQENFLYQIKFNKTYTNLRI